MIGPVRYAVQFDESLLPANASGQAISFYSGSDHRANVDLRCQEVVDAVGRPLSEVEEDWLDLLQALHAADVVCNRGRNESWNRHIAVGISLRKPDHFAPLVPMIREVFGRLTQDQLDLRIEQRKHVPTPRYPSRPAPDPIDAVALLSGGLDSAACATEVIANHRDPCFVAHRSASHVVRAQRAVTAALSARSNTQISTTGFRVELHHNNANAPLPKADLSQRSRTLLFCGVAALIAAARGIDSVVLGENGVMAINCPLTAGRVAGFSTHTAHPGALAQMKSLFTAVLGRAVEIRNPLLHATKAEIVRRLLSAGMGPLIPDTHSCWIARTADHCGRCVPCIVRRFAAEAAGGPDAAYTTDVFANPPAPEDEQFANLGDYLLFATTLRDLSDDELLLEFAELNVEGGEAAIRPILGLHRRWAADVLGVASRYPALATLL